MSKAKEISEGWLNVGKQKLGVPDQAVEAMAKRRMDICNACEFKRDTVCGKCGCPLVAKTRSPHSTCPIDKW